MNLDNTISRLGSRSVKWDIQAKKYGKEGLIPFWIADMDFPAPECASAAIQKRVQHPFYGYTAAFFDFGKVLCSWMKRRHNISWKPEWVLQSQNTMTAISIALRMVTMPNDRVLVMTPVYDAFFTAIRSANREDVQFPLTDTGFSYDIDWDKLEEYLSTVQCLLLCNPHNPIGKAWKKEELERIVSLCERYNVFILSDDAHCDLVLEGRYTSIYEIDGAEKRSIIFTTASKTFNLAGFSTSNVIIKDETIRKKFIAETSSLYIKAPVLLAAEAVHESYLHGDSWLDDVLSYIRTNKEEVQSMLSQTKLKVYYQNATFLMWIDCRELLNQGENPAAVLIDRYGISVNDGSLYGDGGEGFIRMNIACPKEQLRVGLNALLSWNESTEKNRLRMDE